MNWDLIGQGSSTDIRANAAGWRPISSALRRPNFS
jgi:hypothetical protein